MCPAATRCTSFRGIATRWPHARLTTSRRLAAAIIITFLSAKTRFSFAAWAALLVLSVLAFRREQRREPSFIPPSDGISYANVGDHVPGSRADDPYADKHEVTGAAPAGSATGYEAYGYTAAGHDDDAAFGRPSMDTYGAFADSPGAGRPMSDVRGGDEQSRTMQLAYSDPCE